MAKLLNFVVIALAMLVVVTAATPSHGCSTFSPQASLLSGANYDWSVRGGVVFSMPRGLHKTAFLAHPDGLEPATWNARYASVTITQFGREFPMQGINEAGLAGAVLNGPADYPNHGEHGVISEMQWLQYQFDRWATVAEVTRHVDDLGIQMISGKLHYFLCDHSGDCAAIEFLDGRAHVTRGDALKVRALTNTEYHDALDAFEEFISSGGDRTSAPGDYVSTHRFIRAALYASSGGATPTAIFGNLLDLSSPQLTQWQSVFEHGPGTLHLRSLSSSVVDIHKSEYAVGCANLAKMRVINSTRVGSWEPYTEEPSRQMLNEASKVVAGFTPVVIEGMLRYAVAAECVSH